VAWCTQQQVQQVQARPDADADADAVYHGGNGASEEAAAAATEQINLVQGTCTKGMRSCYATVHHIYPSIGSTTIDIDHRFIDV